MVNMIHVGRRKSAVARAYLVPGTGKIVINGKPVDEYLPLPTLVQDIRAPFTVTETNNKFDTNVIVRGGGLTGQAGAIRLAIARALAAKDEEYRAPLRAADLLTRDPRMVERKKYGRPKARKRFQFSKR